MLDCKVGDKVRVKHGWNPMASTRTVTAVDAVTGEAELDCTQHNGIKITNENADIWEVVQHA